MNPGYEYHIDINENVYKYPKFLKMIVLKN